MAIDNFSGNLFNIIQQNYLEREFIDALTPNLGFRQGAQREMFAAQIGESLTKSRASLLPISSLSPINPSTNTPLDDGLTSPSTWNVEQYTLTLNQWGNRTPDLNLIQDRTAIASQLMRNASNLGTQAATTLELLVQSPLYNAYLGGNTRVTTTLGAPGPVIAVDDIRGFQYSFINGFPTTSGTALPVPTSVSATQQVLVGSDVYTLILATPDVVNVSTAPGGISGTLTFSTNVTVLDGTQYNSVVSTVGSNIVRPNGRTNTSYLTPTDVLTLADLQLAVAFLESNNVPKISGPEGDYYNCYLDPTSKQEIFNDIAFQRLFRGTEFKSEEWRNLTLVDGIGLRFIQVNTVPQQNFFTNSLNQVVNVHRPIVMGAECVIEADFSGVDEWIRYNQEGDLVDLVEHDSIYMATRKPIDRQGQFVSQSWIYIGGFVVPTDYLTNSSTIPTATNNYYKRAVVIEHV